MSTVTVPPTLHPPPFFPSIDCWLPLTPHHNPLVLKTDKPSCNSKKASLKENTESAGKAWLLGPTSAPDETTPSPRPTAPWWNQPSQQIFFNPDAKVWANRGGGSFFIFTFIFKGIWVEESENRVGWSASADNANMYYVSFKAQAFQTLVAQQYWASEGHTWNPGTS